MPRSPEEIDRVIGLRVRQARLDIDMSQQKLGDALGLSFQQVQKYEKGMNRIATSTLVTIATALQRPISYFVDEPKYKKNTKGEEAAEFAASRVGVDLIAAAMELRPVMQKRLVDMVKAMHAA